MLLGYHLYSYFVLCVRYICMWMPKSSEADPCELNLQVAMSFMIQELGTELGSSGSMASTLRCCAISPTLDIILN